jgi:hypothetical protein
LTKSLIKRECNKEKALLKKITETRETRKFTNFGQGVKQKSLEREMVIFLKRL